MHCIRLPFFSLLQVRSQKVNLANLDIIIGLAILISLAIDKVQKRILPECRALEFSPAQADQALTERLVRELAPV